MWIIISLAVVLIVGAGCFSFVRHVRNEGHQHYAMRLIKSLSFIITFTSCLILYFGIFMFIMSASQKELTSDEAMAIMFTADGLLDEILVVMVGLAIAFLMNMKKSNFAFALQYTIAQFMTALVAVFIIVAMAVGYNKIQERKRG